MKSKTICLLLLAFVFLTAGCRQQAGNRGQDTGRKDTVEAPADASAPAPAPAEAPPVEVLFPGTDEVLVTGRTYTLKWRGGSDSLSIFLIDSALESVGASVSIADRIYQEVNTGSHDYTVPARLQPGSYKFTIGDGASNYFRVVAPR